MTPEQIKKREKSTQKRLNTTKWNEEDRSRLETEESPEEKRKRLSLQDAMCDWLHEQENLIREAFYDYREAWRGHSYHYRYTERYFGMAKVKRKGKALIKLLRETADTIESTHTGEHPLQLPEEKKLTITKPDSKI